MTRWLRIAAVLLTLVLPADGFAQDRVAERWAETIQGFVASDQQSPYPAGGAVFTGSSSIVRWNTLQEDFPDLDPLNRGFGGSQLSEVRVYLDDLVIKHRPEVVVLYAGENDIAFGRSAEDVFNDYIAIVAEMRRELPETRLVFISVKPGPARWDRVGEVRKVNSMVMEFAARDPLLDYVDVFTPMLNAQGEPIPELFVEDGIHMTPAGYEIWTSVIEPYVRQYVH